jgi:cell division protein FtsB
MTISEELTLEMCRVIDEHGQTMKAHLWTLEHSLAARDRINAQLAQRVDELERELSELRKELSEARALPV